MIMGKTVYAGKTDFQMIADTSKKVMYFKHYDYPNWRSIDLKKLANQNSTTMSMNPAEGPEIPSAMEQMKAKE